MSAKILVVEDERAIAESVVYALSKDGYLAASVATAAGALEQVAGQDLLLLDLMLPDGSGFDLIGTLRRRGLSLPIIVLSSRDGEADRVAALETGADDYVTKPFSPREVVARVRAVLRRVPPPSPSTPGVPPLHVDERTRRATAFGVALELTKVEFDLLASLLEMPGRVYTRQQLIDRVWGDGYAITDRTIDSHIKSLRRKLGEVGAAPGLIETVRGVGYRVTDAPVASEEP